MNTHPMDINPIEKTYRRLTSEGKDILRLFSGNPIDEGFRFPGDILEREYRDYFQRLDYRPDSKGLKTARQAILEYYDRQGARVEIDHILLTTGTSESFSYLFNLLAGPGDNILTPNPSYPLFDPIASLRDIQIRHYPLREDKGWALDLPALQRSTDSRTKAIVLVSPHNPTGSVLSASEINGIVSWANAQGIPLICDEVFSEFYFGDGVFPRTIAVAKPELCFTLNGLSKMFALPSLKLSWIAVSGHGERVVPAVEALELMADTFLSCHTPIQYALPRIFTEGQVFLGAYREEVRKRRDLAVAELRRSPRIAFTEPLGSFYLMGKILKDVAEEDFVISLMEETGVFVHPGYFFDYEDGAHFVISFLTRPEKLSKGIQALINFLGK